MDPSLDGVLSASVVLAHQLVHAGYILATSYPGSPTTLVTDELRRLAEQSIIAFRYASNEKVALEMAAAAALAGARAAVVMKHVGLNVALDSAVALAYTRTPGALLLIVGDDPSCESSSGEQDSRILARLLGVPCLEPASIDEIPGAIDFATTLAERIGTVVMLRLTTALCHASAPTRFALATERAESPRPLVFPKGERRDMRNVLWPATARKARVDALARLDAVRAVADEPGSYSETRDARRRASVGFVVQNAVYETFRRAARALDLDPPTFRSTMAWPLPEAPLRAFLARHRHVVVVEELESLLEEHAVLVAHRARLPTVVERGAGLPLHGRLDEEAISGALTAAARRSPRSKPRAVSLETLRLPARPPTFCAGCPHTASFYTLKRVLDGMVERPFVATDVGCYTLGVKAGIDVGDVMLCMGASIGLATGAAVVGQRSIALIGDSTLAHAGLSALKNAVDQGVDLVVCVFDNGVAAKTGGQAAGRDLTATLLGLGATVQVVDPFDHAAMETALRAMLQSSGVSVLVARSPCALAVTPRPQRPEVDRDRCTGCATCVTAIHCPAISLDAERKFQVDLQRCVGCGFCSTICPEHAVRAVPFARP
jgi:indolepyruvate ferredoxin oxidoreductase alpha subunit